MNLSFYINYIISKLLLNSLASLYISYYKCKVYNWCQIIDYDFYNWPNIYKVVIVNKQYNREFITSYNDIEKVFIVNTKRELSMLLSK